jgi:NAD(P)-dependent dehydrogenase (short-subunit alcohol dehydrogenase family)
VVGRTADTLAETVQAIQSAGGTAALATADIRDPLQVTAAFDRLEANIGPIDSLVNNAAGNFLCPSEELSPNAFNSVVQIVLYGTFHCTLDFGRRIINDGGRRGNILNIVTTYAWMGSPFVLPSACAKAGVLAMTRSLAVEWATYGIRCNAIAPGPIPTKGAFSRLMAGGMEDAAKARIPARRFGKPEELADLAMYLMADGSDYVTGEVVTLDGGEWLQSGQEFASLVSGDRDQVKQMLGAMRPKK